MSFWQFASAVNGYADAYNPKAANELDSDEIDALGTWIETQ